ncbi:hypothetical protein [Paraburkholderia adhaesiva]|uniref:hypothetical protein n=1 Tax=Paraburkholderia adhaesiva TaxID=2883244 RepID=UPI001F45CB41|nr:hypothetical protein [Paraburkholderia adhaesiva]
MMNTVKPLCQTCGDGEQLPQYGVAPHECFYRLGLAIGQSRLKPASEWPDNFELDPESDGQLGIYHCPACGPKFRAGVRVESMRDA